MLVERAVSLVEGLLNGSLLFLGGLIDGEVIYGIDCRWMRGYLRKI